MSSWNTIVTVRQDFARAIALLRKLGRIERTGLYNVLRFFPFLDDAVPGER